MFQAAELASMGDRLFLARVEVEAEWRFIERHLQTSRSELAGEGTRTKRERHQYDSTGNYAGRNLAAGLYGEVTNPAHRWMMLAAEDDDMMAWVSHRKWYEHASQMTLQTFAPGISNFYAETMPVYKDLAHKGHGCLFSKLDTRSGRWQDVAVSMWDVALVYDLYGNLVQVFRKISMTKTQAIKEFGKKCPKKIVDETDQNKRFNFYHVVIEKESHNPALIGQAGMAFYGCYLWRDEKQIVQRGDFHEMPYFAPWWDRESGQTYGHGCGRDALIDAAGLNLHEKSKSSAAQRQMKPPLLAPDKAIIQGGVKPNPGGVTYGAIDRRGNQLVRYLEEGGRSGLELEVSEQKREAIKDAYHYMLMQMVGRSGMSATEVLELSADKARLMGPHIGLVQTNYTTRLSLMRFRALWRLGQIRKPPPRLADTAMKVVYAGRTTQPQKVAAAQGTMSLWEAAGAMAAVQPDIVDRLDGDRALDTLQQGFGAPADVLRDEEETARVRQARQQQMAAAQGATVAREGAAAVKDLAAAAGSGGGQ